MNEPLRISAPVAPGRAVAGRDAARTAALRCHCYAVCSDLVASPHEVDPRPALIERLAAGEAIPYGAALAPLVAEVAAAELALLRTQYSGLFEVGSEGPPAPIREDLQRNQRAGVREEVVRFYDYFGYVLDQKFAWQPDHLSVELEFMHYLCYRESRSAADGADADALSYQLAQLDFTERHLDRWLPPLADNVNQVAAGSLYARVVAAVRDFVVADLEWQRGTVVATGTIREDV